MVVPTHLPTLVFDHQPSNRQPTEPTSRLHLLGRRERFTDQTSTILPGSQAALTSSILHQLPTPRQGESTITANNQASAKAHLLTVKGQRLIQLASWRINPSFGLPRYLSCPAPHQSIEGGVRTARLTFDRTTGTRRHPANLGSLYEPPREHSRVHMLTSLPAIAVACRDVDVRNVKALIIGPHDTPYEFGFFEVLICCESA